MLLHSKNDYYFSLVRDNGVESEKLYIIIDIDRLIEYPSISNK